MDATVILGGLMYLSFQTIYIIAVGGGIVTSVTAMLARVLNDRKYKACARLYTRAITVLFAISAVLFIAVLAIANGANPPPEMVLPYLFRVFGVPLTAALTLTVISVVLLAVQLKVDGRFASRSYLLVYVAAFTGCVSFLFYNLINTFMITPSVPDGLAVVVQAGRLDPMTQLGLMVNRSWVPLSIKVLLVGATAFAVLLSGAAAIQAVAGRDETAHRWHEFLTSWGFKVGIMFGAPLGIIGYWNAAIMHTSTPVLALGLMGEASTGTSQALVSSLSPMWDIGIVGAMSLGGLAGVYYLLRGNGKIAASGNERRVMRIFLPWLLLLLAVSTYATLYVGEWYPQQFVLAFGVLPGGFILFESLRRYSSGQTRLYVPSVIFIAACYGLIAYMGPNTKWYLAKNFGGISWPLIGFPLLVGVVYLLGVHWRKVRYWIPVSAAVIAMLVIVIKSADVELVKGGTIVALDPTVANVVQSWGFLNSYDLSSLSTQYVIPGSSELLTIVILSCLVMAALYYLVARMTHSLPKNSEEAGAS